MKKLACIMKLFAVNKTKEIVVHWRKASLIHTLKYTQYICTIHQESQVKVKKTLKERKEKVNKLQKERNPNKFLVSCLTTTTSPHFPRPCL